MLAKCPNTPNCVCSQYPDDAAHFVAPIAYAGNAKQARDKLKKILAAMPRTKIVQESADRMRVEFTTLLCRYVDDVEFYFPNNKAHIHVRSASRVGYWDLGINRSRVESIRRAMGK